MKTNEKLHKMFSTNIQTLNPEKDFFYIYKVCRNDEIMI